MILFLESTFKRNNFAKNMRQNRSSITVNWKWQKWHQCADTAAKDNWKQKSSRTFSTLFVTGGKEDLVKCNELNFWSNVLHGMGAKKSGKSLHLCSL